MYSKSNPYRLSAIPRKMQSISCKSTCTIMLLLGVAAIDFEINYTNKQQFMSY